MTAVGDDAAVEVPAAVPLAVVTRSGFTESVHHGSAVALDASGAEVVRAGAPGAPVLPRSSLKPLQLVGMLRAGLELEGELLALAMASHSGEPFHLDGVDRILRGAGLTADALRTTPDLPLDPAERLRAECAGARPTPRQHNCSGKHAAMLATCVVNGWDLRTYLAPDHPLQRAMQDAVEELTGEAVAATTVDGCGAPAFAVSLTALATAFRRLAVAAGGAEAAVAGAGRGFPSWLGGTGRDVTAFGERVPGLLVKDGAEGVYAAAMPDGRAVALKIADGSARARPAVLAHLLRRLGVEVPDDVADLPVLGGGRPVGAVRALPL